MSIADIEGAQGREFTYNVMDKSAKAAIVGTGVAAVGAGGVAFAPYMVPYLSSAYVAVMVSASTPQAQYAFQALNSYFNYGTKFVPKGPGQWIGRGVKQIFPPNTWIP